jgi:hypothetical protein
MRPKIYRTHAKLTDKSGRILRKMFGASDKMRHYDTKRGSAKTPGEVKKFRNMHAKAASLLERYRRRFKANAKKLEAVVGKINKHEGIG